MSRRFRSYRSPDEWVGRIILFPFRVAIAAFFLALYVIAAVVLYIPGVFYFFYQTKDESLKMRFLVAFTWPLQILVNIMAFNEFLSLGGMNNPLISRVSNRLEDWHRKHEAKKQNKKNLV